MVLQVVNLLLGLGAQTDARDADGKTPLHCAVHAGHMYALASTPDSAVLILVEPALPPFCCDLYHNG